MALSSSDRSKLIAILGMMGSDHDGEALNAARLASRLVRANKTTWEELLSPTVSAPTYRYEPPPPPMRHWQAKAAKILVRYPDLVSEWEREFLKSLSRRFTTPTEKQAAILQRILRKVNLGE